MKHFRFLTLCIALLFLCSCTMFYEKQPASAPVAQTPKPLVLPVGKNWQLIEEAPKLSDERGRPPFQTEQSVQPGGSNTGTPGDNRIIEIPR